MNCEKVKELLLTCYIDNELDEATAAAVKKHLAECHACAAFEAEVRRSAVEPFRDAPPAIPPKEVWQRVADSIKEETIQRPVQSFTRPVFIAATAAVMLMIAVIFTHYHYAEDRSLGLYVAEELAYLSPSPENGASADDEVLSEVDPFSGATSARGNFSQGRFV